MRYNAKSLETIEKENQNEVDTYLSSLPPASQNNSRQIVRGLIEKFNRNPSERLAGYIEEMTGLQADFLDSDVACASRGGDYND